jgi:VanZ family protein
LWGPPGLLAALIYGLSSLSQIPGEEYVSDKLGHAVVFGLLAVLTLRATHGGWRPLRLAPAALAAALVLGWGALDEVHQRFVPGRYASVLDVGADAVGAALALALWALWWGRPAARIPRARAGTGGQR